MTIAPGITRFDMSKFEEPNIPWFVIQPDADEVVPPQMVYGWLETLSAQHQLEKIPEASHFFHGKLIVLREQLKRYFS